MPVAIASHGTLLPTASMEIWPVPIPVSGLVPYLAGVTNTAHDAIQQARLSHLGMRASAAGQNDFAPSMMHPEAMAPAPAGSVMPWGQSNFDPATVHQAPAPPQAAMAMTWGPRTCAMPLSGDDVHAPAPAQRARNPITARLLQDIRALGPHGIQSAGGLAALARQHDVSGGALTSYIRKKGTLTAKGEAKIQRDVLQLPTKPITGRLLLELSALGPAGIESAGGVAALAHKHGVSVRSLQAYILETGRLTALGQDKINTQVHGLATQPITGRLLQELSALGPVGIKDAGGVGGLALKHRVSVGSLQRFILETGRLTAQGQDKIKSEVLEIQHKPVTARLLQELSELGPDGIQGAGGLGALALQHGVSVNSLHLFIRETGRLTVSGQAKIKSEVLGLRPQPITNQLLQKVSALGPVGIKDAGGVAALALKHGVSVDRLRLLIRETGQLTALGQAKVNLQVHGLRRQPITGEMLQELSALGRGGIQRAGGVAAWGLERGVAVAWLRKLILDTGDLTALGQDKVNTEVLGLQHKPITGQLLQELSALGPERIKRAGGVGALALQHGVSVNSLHKHMREDGSLTTMGSNTCNLRD
jgi:hypothetical protein